MSEVRGHLLRGKRPLVHGDALNLANPGPARFREVGPTGPNEQPALGAGLIISRIRGGLRTVDKESQKAAVVGKD